MIKHSTQLLFSLQAKSFIFFFGLAITLIFCFTISSTDTGFSWKFSTIPIKHKLFSVTRNGTTSLSMEHAYNYSQCSAWANLTTLLQSDYPSIHHSIFKNLLVTTWRHKRSGAPSAKGTVTSFIINCEPWSSMHRAYISSKQRSSSDKLPETLVSEVARNDYIFNTAFQLCENNSTPAESLPVDTTTGTYTIVLPPASRRWVDEMPTSEKGANIWHFHASAFRLWLSLHLPHAIFQDSQSKRYLFSTKRRMIPPTYVLLLLAHAPCKAANMPNTPFQVTDEILQQFLNKGVNRSTLEAIQALSDILGPNLLIACQKLSTNKEIVHVLEENKFPKVKAVIAPPEDGFFWDLAHDEEFAKDYNKDRCTGSLIQQYADGMRNIQHSFPLDKSSTNLQQYRREDDKNHGKIARHVCFVSRQTRERTGSDSRGKLRNLDGDFMRQLMIRLASPIVLSPNLGLRDSNSRFVPSQLQKASISGQLRYVHEECAVLVGVHGAGLTNILGLTQGTAVIELVKTGKSYQYFRNLAALMDETSYDCFNIKSKSDSPKVEADLYVDDRELSDLIELINQRLEESLNQQEKRMVA